MFVDAFRHYNDIFKTDQGFAMIYNDFSTLHATIRKALQVEHVPSDIKI